MAKNCEILEAEEARTMPTGGCTVGEGPEITGAAAEAVRFQYYNALGKVRRAELEY